MQRLARNERLRAVAVATGLLLCVSLAARRAWASSPPTQAWVAHYDGPGNGLVGDRVTGMAVDGAGNVYVAGYSAGSGTGYDYATLKYDASGNQLWVARYNGPGNGHDYAYSLALDGSGNVYVTGVSVGVSTDNDYATVKYNSAGHEEWVARYNGPGNGYDQANAVVVDAGGSIYVTGESTGVGTSTDYATVKYDPDGNQLWAARYNGPWPGDNWATAVAMDGNGNVIVTGETPVGPVPNRSFDCVTVKYNSEGSQLWAADYNGPGNGNDRGNALAVDGAGNVYVAGYSDGGSTGGDYITLKYDGAGNQLWAARYDQGANDWAWSLALDTGGNVYVTGHGGTSGETGFDCATVKYDGAGHQLWVARYDSGWSDDAMAVAVDACGSVYVAGRAQGAAPPPGADFLTLKYVQDATPPVFSAPVTGVDGAGRKTVSLSVQDACSGLASVRVVKASNCTLTVAGNPVAVGGTYTFSPAPTTPQPVVATKINQAVAASFTLFATDVAGNGATFDPVIATLKVPAGRSSVSRTFHGVPAAEHYLSLQNGTPGMRAVTVFAGYRRFHVALEAGQNASLDLSGALRERANEILLIASGRPGATLQVMVADTAGAGVGNAGTAARSASGNNDWRW